MVEIFKKENSTGNIFYLQLKGSGPTPYSRRGDGLATLKAMTREYIISEAMDALNIPTSNALAVIATGERVFRTVPEPGAMLVRIMKSHIRVGTFEYARYFLDDGHIRMYFTVGSLAICTNSKRAGVERP